MLPYWGITLEGSWGGWQAGGGSRHAGLQREQTGLSPRSCTSGPELRRGRGCQGRKASTGSEAGLSAAVPVPAQPRALITARSGAAVAGGLRAADKGERGLSSSGGCGGRWGSR